MINSITVFLFNVILFVIVDWKELMNKETKLSRWTYISILGMGLAILYYMDQTMDPFRPVSWFYYKVEHLF